MGVRERERERETHGESRWLDGEAVSQAGKLQLLSGRKQGNKC